jgi:hypothetical protein
LVTTQANLNPAAVSVGEGSVAEAVREIVVPLAAVAGA